jgi:hypothetical protein
LPSTKISPDEKIKECNLLSHKLKVLANKARNLGEYDLGTDIEYLARIAIRQRNKVNNSAAP